MLEITEIRFEIKNQVGNQLEIKVISRAWKSQKSGLKSEISWLVSKSRTRFQQVSDPLDSAGETGLGGQEGYFPLSLHGIILIFFHHI